MNLSYCRFHNTLADLRDCHTALTTEPDPFDSAEEAEAAKELIALCKRIAAIFGEEPE